MKIKNGYILREVGGTPMVIAVGDAARDFCGMITLNEVGAFLWRALERGATQEALVNALLNEYDVGRETAAADVAAFVAKVREAGILDE